MSKGFKASKAGIVLTIMIFLFHHAAFSMRLVQQTGRS